jgi:hypothetical protein
MSRAHISEIINYSAPSLFNQGSDGVFHAPQNLEKGGHGISPRTMHHLKIFFPGLESVLFRTLSYFCRVPDKFPRSDHRK